MSSPMLEVRGLTMRFGGVVALDAVDFTVDEVELRCLIGPNGAGKSTFFKCLTGFYRPTAGTVRLRGQSIVGLGAPRIARLGVGIKTQVPSVFDGLDVRENIRLAAARVLPPLLARRRVEDMLARFGVGGIATTQVGRLAHGHRQLVELAMVLAPDSDLVLLDEPAAGMTGHDIDRLVEIVLEMSRSHAVIVVEHDMDFVRRIARTVTVFHQGAVLAEGPVREIMANAQVRAVYLGKAA